MPKAATKRKKLINFPCAFLVLTGSCEPEQSLLLVFHSTSVRFELYGLRNWFSPFHCCCSSSISSSETSQEVFSLSSSMTFHPSGDWFDKKLNLWALLFRSEDFCYYGNAQKLYFRLQKTFRFDMEYLFFISALVVKKASSAINLFSLLTTQNIRFASFVVDASVRARSGQ